GSAGFIPPVYPHAPFPKTTPDTSEPQGTLIDLPDPRGISGGGIFRMTQPGEALEEWTPEDVKLVGVVHEWNLKLAVLEGTHMRVVLQLLLDAYPGVRSAMEINYPGMIQPQA